MKKTYKFSTLLMMCLASFCLLITSCLDGDDIDTNQYQKGIALNVFGPCPVARGGELRFLGSGLDQVSAIVFPGCENKITEITVLSAEEIRVTVPQDAEVGYLTLETSKGEITTKTPITYSEPISIDAITPMQIKPGQTLTVKGDYLNLIQEVIFPDDVVVNAKDFTAHSRKEIKLVVPAQAKSGKAIFSDGAEIPNWIYSDEALAITLPSVEKALDLTGAKPGSKVTVTVKDIDLVEKVTMPNGDEVEFAVEGDKLSFVLPNNSTDGAICMVTASEVSVAIANIGMALPAELVAEPATGIRGGDVITIKGINLEVVTDITFPGVADAVKADAQTATEIKVTMPAAAISGQLMLNTGSGVSVPLAIETQKPESLTFDNASVSLGSDVIIKGKNLDLVSEVIFTGGATVAVTPTSATELTVQMPTSGAETGALTLKMANGETVETETLTINAPEFCYIPALPDEETEIKAGEVFQIGVKNGDKLTGVQIDGIDCQYIINGELLFINVPSSAGKKSETKLVSSNGEIIYKIAYKPATEVETAVMSTMHDLGSWANEAAGGAFRIYKADLVAAGFAAGCKLRFFVSPYAFTQIQINDANWGQVNMIEGNAEDFGKVIEWEIDEATAKRILETNDGWSDTGFVIQGAGVVINKVTVWYQQSVEETLWSGNVDLGSWSINYSVTPNTMFADYGIKAGQTIRFYVSDIGAEPKMNLFSGHWVKIVEMDGSYFDGKCFSYTVTADDATALINDIDWGQSCIVQGQDATLTKITVE